MADQSVCSIHLGPNGMESKTLGEAKAEFAADMRKCMLSPFVTRDAKEVENLLEQQRAARERFAAARFYQHRDASAMSKDILEDPIVDRRRRHFSVTRDMMHGPASLQNVFDVTGRGGLQRAANSGSMVDRDRFLREADRLRMRGIIDEKELPDWDDDTSINKFFSSVHAKAHEEARNNMRNPGHNRVIDSAPGIYLFTELLKRSEKLIEEDFTELWARRIFPIMDLNTWLPQWLYERIDDRAVFPQYVDTEYLPSNAPRGSENRAPVLRPLAFWHHAASWSNIELMRYAEAVANGAPNVNLDQRRINAAIRMMDWKEDILAFFGDPDLDIHGLLSPEADTGIERIPSGGGFAAGDTEADRELMTREVKLILENTEQALRPDTIMLPTAVWTYVNDKRYGNLSADSNQTVLEAAEATLRRFGIRDILWVPEVGWTQAQQDRLEDHGVTAPESQRLAGGLDGNNTMVIMKRDAEVCEMVVAKNRVMYPARETVNDRVEARMMQGGGGMVFYKPEGVKIVTDVGPNPA